MSPPPFKYSAEIMPIPSCPPSAVRPCKGILFRFVFEDAAHPNNFRPPAVIQPERKFANDEGRCGGYALSMFVTEAKAVAFYQAFLARRKNAYKILGTHLAEVAIEQTDALVTPADTKGHVDVHETQGVDWAQKHRVLRKIHEDG